MNTKLKQVLIAGLLLSIGVVARSWASDPIDASITVTPNVTVNLALSVTTYAFGSLNVAVSSVTASSITLRNTGNVDVTIDKSIVNAGGWTAANIAGSGTPGLNTFALYVTTSSVRPATDGSDFTVAAHLFDGTGSPNKLKSITGVDVSTITVSGSTMNEAYLWFRLDMPTQVTSSLSREITMRFDGVALP